MNHICITGNHGSSHLCHKINPLPTTYLTVRKESSKEWKKIKRDVPREGQNKKFGGINMI